MLKKIYATGLACSFFMATSLLGTALAAPQKTATASNSPTKSNLQYEFVAQWNLSKTPVDMAPTLDGKHVFFLTDDHQVLVYTPEGQLTGTIPVDKTVTSIQVAPRGEYLYLMDKEKKSYSVLSVDYVRNIDVTGVPSLGPDNAPVKMVLFTDFQCPYCKKLEPLLQEVLKKNSKTVKLYFKNMPLQFHKFAEKAARAALAADKQGKFWEFHDALFAQAKLSNEAIETIAKDLKLNIEQWKKDMNSPEITEKIGKDIHDAEEAGVTGTPTIFINGKILKQRSMQGFQSMIDEEIKH